MMRQHRRGATDSHWERPLRAASAVLLVAAAACSSSNDPTQASGASGGDGGRGGASDASTASGGAPTTGQGGASVGETTSAGEGGSGGATHAAAGSGGGGAAVSYAYDLDADGANDSNLSVATCSNDALKACAVVTSEQWGNAEYPIADAPVYSMAIGTMGKFFSGPLRAVYIYWTTSDDRAALSIFDVNGPGYVAWVTAPSNRTHYDTYFALVGGPDGKKYPFLAPGAGYIPPKDGLPWQFLCQFDPAAIANPDPACGTGFRSVQTMYTAEEVSGTYADPGHAYRHNGGFLDDADGDGWDDIHLPYLWVVRTISGKTGQPLATTFFDVGPSPTAPGFHSGRNYGSFTSFTTESGSRAVLIASANAVGTFQDVHCNVSKFHAVLESTPGIPASRHLFWSEYHSFTKNIFQPPYGPMPVVLRLGDMMNGCAHRFSDSLFSAGNRPITIYSSFTSDTPAKDCMTEQYAEVTSNFSPEALEAWGECATANFLPVTGSWTVKMLDVETAGGLNSWPNAYAWGVSEKLFPGGEAVYLVETFDDKVRFDRVSHRPSALVVVAVDSEFKWQERGRFPIEGVPKIRSIEPIEGATGASWGGIPELTTSDVDGDGLDEIELEDGTKVGYSADRQQLVVK